MHLLLFITVIEFIIALYLKPHGFFGDHAILIGNSLYIGLTLLKAFYIVAYFMHLKFERLSLVLTIVPMLVVCILLLLVFFPDSFRSAGLRYKFKEPPPVPAESPEP